jgi:hypothetical protein
MIKFASSAKPGDVTKFGTVVAAQRGFDKRAYHLILSNGTEVKLNRFQLIRTKRV